MATSKFKKPYKCRVCKKKFALPNDLRRHLRIHTGERPFPCTECPAKFTQSNALRNHMVSLHSGLKPFLCGDCGKSFAVKERLRLHVRVHTGEKPYSCKDCPKTFARGSQLIQHRRCHTGQRPFKCTECQSAFTCSTNLKVHLKRHMGQKDFECKVCGKKFTRRDGLQKHLSCFHGGEKPFECTICKKRYKGHLMQHLRTHLQEKPHRCNVCGAMFVQRSQLTVHQRTHTGEKPYGCKVCGRFFAHSTALKLHNRRHTGEKPFRCLLCPSTAFVQLPHLKKHMRCIHHTEKPYLCLGCRGFFKTKAELDGHRPDCPNDGGPLPPNKRHNCTQTDVEYELDTEVEPDVEAKKNDAELSTDLNDTETDVDITEEVRSVKEELAGTKKDIGDNMDQENQASTSLPRSTRLVSKKRSANNCTDEMSNISPKVSSSFRTRTTRSSTHANIRATTPPKTRANAKATKVKTKSLNSKKSLSSKEKSPDDISLPKTRASLRRQIFVRNGADDSAAHETKRSCKKPKAAVIVSKSVQENGTSSKKVGRPSRSFDLSLSVSQDEELLNSLIPTTYNESPSAPMTLDHMRSRVALLLQKISNPEKLNALGLGHRSIDDVLHDSIAEAGRDPCDANLPEGERLRKNVEILLDWTIPDQFMEIFRQEQRTTEELLDELTS